MGVPPSLWAAQEEAAAQALLEELEVQKHMFIKDVKRVRNEEASKFNTCPILNDRCDHLSASRGCGRLDLIEQ